MWCVVWSWVLGWWILELGVELGAEEWTSGGVVSMMAVTRGY